MLVKCRKWNGQSVFQASRLGYDLGIVAYFFSLHIIIVMGGQVMTGYFVNICNVTPCCYWDYEILTTSIGEKRGL